MASRIAFNTLYTVCRLLSVLFKVALAAGAEAAGHARAREAAEEYVPGDLGVDPFRKDSAFAARGAILPTLLLE